MLLFAPQSIARHAVLGASVPAALGSVNRLRRSDWVGSDLILRCCCNQRRSLPTAAARVGALFQRQGYGLAELASIEESEDSKKSVVAPASEGWPRRRWREQSQFRDDAQQGRADYCAERFLDIPLRPVLHEPAVPGCALGPCSARLSTLEVPRSPRAAVDWRRVVAAAAWMTVTHSVTLESDRIMQ